MNPLAPDDPRHGTVNGYSNLKCRCSECRSAWATYQRRASARRAIAPDDPRHGKATTYTNYPCRCTECRAVMAAYHRARRGKSKTPP